MELTVEKKGPCEALVSFTVPAGEFGSRVEQGLKAAARNVRVKGFRPGKVPTSFVEKSHGEAIRREARAQFLQEAYQQAVAEHELKPAAHPHVDVDEIEHAAGDPLAHSFQVWLRPDLDLGEYKGQEIEGRSVAVSEEELDAAIEDVRNQRSSPEPTGEGGLPEDGVAQCKVAFLSDGEEVLSREGLQVRPNAPLAGIDEDSFREALTGAVEGDARELAFTFPAEFEKEELRGQEGQLRIEVGPTFRVVPATDEDLFQVFEVEDEAGLRGKVQEEITRVKSEQEARRVEEALLEEVIQSHPMELPEAMVKEQAERRSEGLRQQLGEQGLKPEEIEQHLAGQGDASYEASARALRAYFLIDEIAKAESLQVEESELIDELHSIAARNEAPFEEVRDYYREQNLFNQLAMELLEKKVRTFLRENASLSNPD